MHRWIGAALAILITGAVAWAATAFTPVGSNNLPLFTPTNPGYVFNSTVPLTTTNLSYQVDPTNCGGMVVESGALQTVTLPPVTAFPTSCRVTVVNSNATRAQKMVGFPIDLNSSGTNDCGAGNFCLWPNQSVAVAVQLGQWTTTAKQGRYQHNGITVYADSASGSDNNDCLAPGTGACATLNQAYNIACYATDPGLGAVQVLASGTFHSFSSGGCGVPRLIQINGNPSATINDNGVPGIAFECDDVCQIQLGVSGTITVSVTGAASQNIEAQRGGIIDVSNTTFRSSAGSSGIVGVVKSGGRLNLNSGNTFAGGSGTTLGSLVTAITGGQIVTGTAQTVTGTWTLNSGCVASSTGVVDLTNGAFTGGTVTAPIYSATLAGGITASSGCPGNAGGTATAPGWAS